MSRSLAWLALALTVVLGSCTIPLGKVEREPVESAPGEPAILRDYGLDCSRCMFSWGSGCSLLEGPGSSLVGVVTGARVANELQECVESGGGGGLSSCVIHRAYRFDDLKFLRRPTNFKPTDGFSGSERVDSRNHHEGLQLKSDKRYVLIASQADSASSARAEWNLAAACEVPATATFPAR